MSKYNVKLATTESVSGNYAGELAAPYVAAALLAGNTLSQNAIRIIENVKYQTSLRSMKLDSILDAANCDWDPVGTVTVADRLLTPTELQVNLQLCKKTYVSQWESTQMAAGRLNQEIPANFTQFLLELAAANVAQEIEYHLWQGEVGGVGSYTRFDGFDHIIDDAGVSGRTVDNTAKTFLSSNNSTGIIPALDVFLGDIPTEVLSQPDFTIYMNQKQAFYYQKALGAAGYNNEYEVNAKPLNYLGYPIVVANGVADTRMFAGPSSNYVFGCDLLSDHNTADVIDMSQTDGSQQVRVGMRFTAGCQVAITDDAYRTHDAAL